MIRNIVLDIGNVLAHFCWEKVLREYIGLEGEEFERVAQATVRGGMWPELDRSELTDKEVLENCIRKSPQDEESIRMLFSYLGDLVVDFDYSEDWIRGLKERGFNVYILSNFGKTSYEGCREKGNLAFVDLTDGALISYEVKKVKPEKEIYQAFLERFSLVPEECLFFDDREDNILAAREQGMNAEVFTDLASAEKLLNRIR
ncbi:MAG: HAD family phosphatase [Parasporobacterium sp.]|nr:HAD family phosphatase [Parasporobacterium sp.]